MDSTEMLTYALAYRHSGLSLIPCHRADKRPRLRHWKPFQEHPPHLSLVQRWFHAAAKTDALAIVTGPVSGGLEVLDFDAPALYPPWCTAVEAAQPGLLDRLPVVQTPSGGSHVYYRAPHVTGNHKLAVDPDKPNGKYTRIETRGTGGYVLAPPSAGYTLVHGALTTIPLLTAAQRALLLDTARSFTRAAPTPPRPHRRPSPTRQQGSLRPGDDYNHRGDVATLLTRHGWQWVKTTGETSHWRRPGKTWGSSATFNYAGRRRFYCFSTNAPPLEPARSYTPFGLYATLDHGGDFAAASRALRQQGFGNS